MLSALLSVMTCAVMSASPGAGDSAPPISIEHALQTPEGVTLDWASLGDAPVLLEFWGTWCGPCVAVIPRLNKIAGEMRDDGLRVIAVTYEEPENIEPFLEARSIDGWVLCDTDRSMVKDFGVTAWPQTFLIKDGMILARTSPSALDTDAVRDVFAGRLDGDSLSPGNMGRVRIAPGRDPFVKDNLGDPIFKLVIREGSRAEGSIAGYDERKTMMSVNVSWLVSWAWGVTPRYVDIDDAVSRQTYDMVAVIPPGNMEQYEHVIREIIERTLGIRVALLDRQITGYTLRAGPGGIKLPVASGVPGEYSMQNGADGSMTITGTSMTIELLQAILSLAVLDSPVRSDIEDDQYYDVELRFTGREPAQVIEAFREQAGIEVAPYKTMATFAVVSLADMGAED